MAKRINDSMYFPKGTIHLRRRQVLGGEGGSPLPMFADARGVGVLGLPTSAILSFLIAHLHPFSFYSRILTEEEKEK